METVKDRYYTVTELKSRNWTESAINRLLGEPDELRNNPRYSSGHPMRLYAVERVEAAEQTPQFAKVKDQRARRVEAAERGAETRRKNIESAITKYVAEVVFVVPQLPREKLEAVAREHQKTRQLERQSRYLDYLERTGFEDHNGEDDGGSCFPRESETDFLNRITVNYLRHRLTAYESHLREIGSKSQAVGINCESALANAYVVIKGKVLDAIALTYSWLADECQKQKANLSSW